MTEFYKVSFYRVSDLIRSRRVYLSQGIAYIPQIDLVSLFLSYFRKNLLDGMPVSLYYIYFILFFIIMYIHMYI